VATSLLSSCGEPDPIANPEWVAGATPKGRILFVQQGDIYLWQDGKIRRLLQLGDAASPNWAPDGRQFVFVRFGDAYSDLYLADDNGANVQQLTRNRPPLPPGTEAYVRNCVWALDPVWMPDGQRLAYVSDLNSVKNLLWIVQSRGGAPQLIRASTVLGDNVESPTVAPDGTRIAFAHRTTTEAGLRRRTDIWVVNLDTGQLVPLVQGGDGSYAPAWSPDGAWIAYVGRHGDANDLFVVPASGGDPVQLTTTGAVASPTWSPDGRMIAFLQPEGTSFGVYYVEFSVGLDGQPSVGEPKRLFRGEGIDAPSGLSWAP
jgi:TolB protein